MNMNDGKQQVAPSTSSDGVTSFPPTTTITKCLGTRRLTQRIRHENGTTCSNGMIATFCHHQDEEGGGAPPTLLVLVTDGTRTFRGRIDPREATHRVPWNQQQYCVLNNASSSSSNANPPPSAAADIRDDMKVQILSNFLLEDDPKDVIVVTYDYIHEGRDGIQLEIKHNDTTMGVTRILGSHTLVPTTTTSSNGLEFANTLGTVVNDSIAQIQHYQTQQEILQTNLSNWKDTAEKLDRDWQQEKDVLLNRFLQLYKRAHLQLRESQSKVQQLQQELMLQARAFAIDNHNNNNNKSPPCKKQKRAPRPLPPPLPTYTALPDDNDAQQFDSEMVNMLAAGKTMEKSLVEKKRKRSSSSSSTTADGVGGAIRTNPHTGAKEVFDANVLFDDPSFFASSLQTMDSVDETNDKEESGEAKTKTTSANGQDVGVVVDPVMAIAASKLPAKARANHKDKDKDSLQSKRHAKKDSTRVNGNDKDGRVTRTDEVMEDPVMAAAGKLFAAKENQTSNSDGGS